MLECLKYIIGLSQSESTCFEENRPDDFNLSSSGLFLADNFNLNLNWVQSAEDSEQGNLWDMLQSARNEAINHVVGVFPATVRETRNFEAVETVFDGKIGQTQSNSFYSNTFSFLGHVIDPKCIKQSILVLKAVNLKLLNVTVATDIDVNVYSSADLTTPIATTTVTLNNSNAFYRAAFSTPVELDMNPLDVGLRYYVVYELPAGLQVPNNQIDFGCGCGSQQKDRRLFYKKFANVTGIEANSTNDLEGTTGNRKTSGKALGLILEAYSRCDYITQLCQFVSDPSEPQNAFNIGGNSYSLARHLAYAVGYYAAAVLAGHILYSRNINRTTLLDRDTLMEVREMSYQKSKQALKYFCENLPVSFLQPCFTCKKDRGSSIRSLA